jgi:hypothetical protein
MRTWRNWQTRSPQEAVPARAWRFKSSRPHHFFAIFAAFLLVVGATFGQLLKPIDTKKSADVNTQPLDLPDATQKIAPQKSISLPNAAVGGKSARTRAHETRVLSVPERDTTVLPSRAANLSAPRANFTAKRAATDEKIFEGKRISTSRPPISERSVSTTGPESERELKEILNRP